ncbi:MAG TPA: glycosyltransferase family 4 protein [Terriglobia bacterium]|nr:glycosyltransferase family 4 protein [Terriglobia bacterium]
MRELALNQQPAPASPEPSRGTHRAVRLAMVVTHPIQYFAPLFRRLAERPEIDLTVLYADLVGAKPYEDPGFGKTFAWDVPLLEGYRYKALKNYRPGHVEGALSFFSPGVIPELSGRRYDMVVIFGWSTPVCLMALAAARLRGIPVIIYGDSVPLFERRNGWLKRSVKKRMLGALFRRVSAFLTMGTLNRAFYESYGAPLRRFFFCPYPIDNDFFAAGAAQARPRRDAIRARYGIPSNLVLLLFVGKLLGRKRPGDVLAALTRLQPCRPTLGALFVGEGELQSSLESDIRRLGLKNIFLIGFRNQTELPEVYAIADILVLPSEHEPWGLVTNEAMACGLPVVLSNMTGASEDLVSEGENGFVYRCGDVEALAAAVEKLASDSALRERMGRCSERIIKNFSYDRCVEGVLEAVQFIQADQTALPAPQPSDV